MGLRSGMENFEYLIDIFPNYPDIIPYNARKIKEPPE
jgi:hypothetical protein